MRKYIGLYCKSCELCQMNSRILTTDRMPITTVMKDQTQFRTLNMEEMISCDLSVDALTNMEHNDFVVIEFVVTESQTISFVNVVVNVPEVFEN